MRRSTAIMTAVAAAALVASVLAGCAPSGRGPGNQPAGCTPELPSGDASSIVKAPGAVGTAPKKASMPTPLIARNPQVTVVRAGSGAPASVGSQVMTEFTIFDGKTGTAAAATAYTPQQAYVMPAGSKITDGSGGFLASTLSKAVVCAQAGSRIVLTAPAKSLGLGDLSSYGLTPSSSAVVVIDVVDVYLGKADGVNLLPQDGMPDVITAVDGQPGIVLQELGKPTTARSAVIKAGGGAVLKRGQTGELLYTTWTWPASGEKPVVVDALDTWSTRVAKAVPLKADDGTLPAKVIDALVGQKVGSQVLVVLPPKDAFPASSEPQGVTSADTLIFVVDILGVQK